MVSSTNSRMVAIGQTYQKIYPQILTKIKFELSEKPSKKQKEERGQYRMMQHERCLTLPRSSV
jgi:hypothetical protein